MCFYFTTAIFCISGMVYTEFKFKNIWKEYNSDRSNCWSYMVTWIGAALMLISSMFSFISIFLKPREEYQISSPSERRRNRYPSLRQSARFNKGNIAYDSEDVNRPIQNSHIKKPKQIANPESAL